MGGEWDLGKAGASVVMKKREGGREGGREGQNSWGPILVGCAGGKGGTFGLELSGYKWEEE